MVSGCDGDEDVNVREGKREREIRRLTYSFTIGLGYFSIIRPVSIDCTLTEIMMRGR
jgi:hypothetical protein